MLKQITFCLFIATIYSQYSLNLNFPLLLDNSYANISTVNQDLKNGFYAGFKDGQFRHYTSDFSTYEKNNFSYVVEYANTWWFNMNNFPLSNGSLWSMYSIATTVLADNYLSFKIINFTTLDQLFSYSTNEKIIAFAGFPIQFFSSFIPNHVLICNETIKIIYNGYIHSILNFSQTYQPGVICDSAISQWWYENDGIDYYEFKYVFYLSLSNKSVLKLTVQLNFTMNYTSSSFDLSHNIINSTIFSSPDRINKILILDQLLLMQSNSTGAMYLYSTTTLSMGTVDAAIPKNQAFSFFNKFNNFYILQSYGLISVAYSAATNMVSFVSVVSLLPYNTYGLAFGSKLDILYIPNTPYIYKAGKCMNQTLLEANNKCQQYSCLIANCYSCSFTSFVCSICNPGFTRNELSQCTNSTITLNSTTSNSSNGTNSSQQQNSTIGPNQALNSSDNSVLEQNQQMANLFVFLNAQWILQFMKFLIQLLKKVISFPATRRLVTPLFYYFGNFDDLFLYSYHNREYGDTMNSIFQQISAIEKQKWSLFSVDQLSTIIGVKNPMIQKVFGFQRQYLPASPSKQGLYYLGFFENCTDFILIEAPIILLGFIISKLVFKALSNFYISQIFRRFNFWIYFAIIIFDGNVQQFSFYLTPELKTVFAFEYANKYVKVLVFFIAYCLLIFAVCGYVIGLSFYKKLNRYFTDNNKNILHGNWILILQNGIRNMILGITHSLFRNGHYLSLISTLLVIESIFFIIIFLGISDRIYIQNKKIWIYVSFTLLRMLLIAVFLIDRAYINYILFQQIEKMLIFQMIALYLLSIIFLLYQILILSVRFLCGMFRHIKASSFDIQSDQVTNQSYLNRNTHRIQGQSNFLKVNHMKKNNSSKQLDKLFKINIGKMIIYFQKVNNQK